MSKALSRNTHWLPKTGSYAVRLNRRGDIGDAKPVEASDEIYAALTERTRRAQAEMQEIEKLLPTLRGDDRKAVFMKRLFQLQAELKNLRFGRLQAYLPRYAEAFLSAARLLLSADALAQIDNLVVAKVGTPPRHWQRFLGDNGYGVCDTSTYEREVSAGVGK
jgi:hypothetical protein